MSFKSGVIKKDNFVKLEQENIILFYGCCCLIEKKKIKLFSYVKLIIMNCVGCVE